MVFLLSLCVSSYYQSCYYQPKMAEGAQGKDVYSKFFLTSMHVSNVYPRPCDSLQYVGNLILRDDYIKLKTNKQCLFLGC